MTKDKKDKKEKQVLTKVEKQIKNGFDIADKWRKEYEDKKENDKPGN